MKHNQLAKPTKYSESKEEAKHPGAALGLIMGVYPAILIAGLLIAIAILGFRSMFPPTLRESTITTDVSTSPTDISPTTTIEEPSEVSSK